MTKSYFQVAEPLSKEDFLTVYKESILLIQLIFAPFGITESSLDIIGDEEKVIEMYSTVFQQYEDIVSKRLFKMKGYDDDRIIASMHKYVGEAHDVDIINELKMASQALKLMIVSSNVVEFDFPINEEYNIINSLTASLLLDKVLNALKPLLYGDDHEVINREICIAGVNLYKEDISISKLLPIHIPIRTFSPICSYSRAPFREISLQSIDAIKSLLTSLTLTIDEILPNLDLDNKLVINYKTCNRLISFTLQQYHCLLDLFGDDPLVQKVIAKHMNYCDSSNNDNSNSITQTTTIQDVRNGVILNSLNLSTQPSILFVSQLELQLQRLTNRKSIILESNCDSDTDEKKELSKLLLDIENIETLLQIVEISIKLRKEAQEAAVMGDFNKAIMLLSEDLLDYLDSDSSDDDEEVVVVEEKIVKPKQMTPTYLKVASLIERASYYIENGDLEFALADCTSAIKLDNQCSKAYSMRSQISLQLIQQSNLEEEEGDEREEDKISKEDEREVEDCNKDENVQARQMLELQKAAEDALLAFLLDGSSDLSLASAAEEAAREACRMTAKEVYYSRRSTLKEINQIDLTETSAVITTIHNNVGNNFPRSWFVGAYFAAYEQISIALSIYQPSTHFNKQIMKYRMKTSLNSNNTDSELQDIDMDQTDTLFSSSFEVPSFLWNLTTISNDNENSIIEEKNNEQVENQQLFDYSQCKRDNEGYALLICLSELIEAVTYDKFIFANNNSDSNNKKKKVESQLVESNRRSDISHHHHHHYEHVMEPNKEDSSDAYIHKSFHMNHHSNKDLISEGLCQCSSSDEAINKFILTTDIEVVPTPACKYYFTALKLLRGEIDSSSIDGNCDNVAVTLESFFFLKDLRLLDKDSVEELTGVVFASNGSIESILNYSLPTQIIFNDQEIIELTNNSKRKIDNNNNNKIDNNNNNKIDKKNNEEEVEDEDEDGWETCDDSGDEDNCSNCNNSNSSVDKMTSHSDDPIKEIEIALSKINATILSETSTRSFEINNKSNSNTISDIQPSISNQDASEIKKTSNTNVKVVSKDGVNDIIIKTDTIIVNPISHRLRARLLNICGSFAYLAGDAIGAVKCFRASIEQDPYLIDSQLKLGSLLIDMDELKEASTILSAVNSKDPNNMVILLHMAELATHQNQFDVAIKHLRQARLIFQECGTTKVNLCNCLDRNNNHIRDIATLRTKLLTAVSSCYVSPIVRTVTDLGAIHNCQTVEHYKRRVEMSGCEMSCNIHSLLGINLFRQAPQHPEIALHTLQSALDTFKDSSNDNNEERTTTQKESPILLLCCGEVYNQLGDMVNALNCYQKAHELAPDNPLCYINAARTYQQLSQLTTSEQHLQAALKLDPALAMVRVDLAQNLLISGKASSALLLLQEALDLARQVSEIRDVLTAQMIAILQIDFETRGLYFNQ